MRSNNSSNYNVDIVMCIDATGSMGGLIDKVKSNALSFYSDLTKSMEAKGKNISQLRVRLVVFRDYLADGTQAMLQTEFLTLPEQDMQYKGFLDSVTAFGGGDNPEDGLEALAFAMHNSKWTMEQGKHRHIIVVWTDAATHPLGFGKSAPNYPGKMAKSFDELTAWWGDADDPGCMPDQSAKRLLMFAPDEPYWNMITENWDNSILYPSDAGNGMDETDYASILDVIANSI